MGLITKGMGAILKKIKPKSKSKWTKDKTGTITGVKAGSGNVPDYVGAGKSLKDRAKIVKTWSKVKTIDKIHDAENKISQGKKELKNLRQTGWTKPIGKGKDRKYFPKAE